jgi:hypothetical protein
LVFEISTSNVSGKRNVLSDLFNLICDSMIWRITLDIRCIIKFSQSDHIIMSCLVMNFTARRWDSV